MTELSPSPDLETKVVDETASGDVAQAFDDFMGAFEAFKETNDERLSELERRTSADTLTLDKLDRINQSIDEHKRLADELALKAGRPTLAGAAPRSTVTLQHKAAFESYVRRGEERGLHRLEEKALSVGSDPDGGFLVPEETEQTVMRSLKDISPIRSIASVRRVSSTTYKKPFAITGPGSGWVGETDARPETTSPTLAELSFPTMELYAMPSATQTLLDDSAVNIDEWLAEEIRIAFAEQEGTAFVSGDGVNKPRGFLDYPTVDNSSWTWGNIGYVATGTDGAFDASDPSDDLIDLLYTVKSGYRANGWWVMNRAVQAEIRKFKDADGNYLWRPGDQAGAPPSLMAYPIAESEDMPNIASDSLSIAFGDFNRGYLIVDRIGLRVLRDPFSSKPFVLFYTTKRVGGGVQDFDAIKFLKFGVS